MCRMEGMNQGELKGKNKNEENAIEMSGKEWNGHKEEMERNGMG